MNKDTVSDYGGVEPALGVSQSVASLNASSAVGASGKIRKSRARRLAEAVNPEKEKPVGIQDQTYDVGQVTITVEPTVSKLDSFFQAKQRATFDSSRNSKLQNMGSQSSSRVSSRKYNNNNVSIVERLRGSSQTSFTDMKTTKTPSKGLKPSFSKSSVRVVPQQTYASIGSNYSKHNFTNGTKKLTAASGSKPSTLLSGSKSAAKLGVGSRPPAAVRSTRKAVESKVAKALQARKVSVNLASPFNVGLKPEGRILRAGHSSFVTKPAAEIQAAGSPRPKGVSRVEKQILDLQARNQGMQRLISQKSAGALVSARTGKAALDTEETEHEQISLRISINSSANQSYTKTPSAGAAEPTARKAFNDFKKPALFKGSAPKEDLEVARLPSSIALMNQESATLAPVANLKDLSNLDYQASPAPVSTAPVQSQVQVQNIQTPLELTKIKSGMQTFDSPALAFNLNLNLTPSEKQTPAAETLELELKTSPKSDKSAKPLSLPLFRKRHPNSKQKFLSMQNQLNDQQTIEALHSTHKETLLLLTMQNVHNRMQISIKQRYQQSSTASIRPQEPKANPQEVDQNNNAQTSQGDSQALKLMKQQRRQQARIISDQELQQERDSETRQLNDISNSINNMRLLQNNGRESGSGQKAQQGSPAAVKEAVENIEAVEAFEPVVVEKREDSNTKSDSEAMKLMKQQRRQQARLISDIELKQEQQVENDKLDKKISGVSKLLKSAGKSANATEYELPDEQETSVNKVLKDEPISLTQLQQRDSARSIRVQMNESRTSATPAQKPNNPNVLILMITTEEQTEFQNLHALTTLAEECNLKITNAESFEQGERHHDTDIVISNLYGVNDDEIQKNVDFYMFYCQSAANIAWICHTEEDDQYSMIQTMNAKSQIYQVPDESENESAEILEAFKVAQQQFAEVQKRNMM